MRPSIDEYFMSMAHLVSTRGTCARRKVGCVLTDRKNHVLATGYNGVPCGMIHCTDKPCEAAISESGKDLDKCLATHAEQNALLQCKDVYSIDTAYVTVSPCIHCVKLLLNTSCQRIVFNEEYPHQIAKDLWESSSRIWRKIDERSTNN